MGGHGGHGGQGLCSFSNGQGGLGGMVCQDDGRMAFMGLASMSDDAGAARSSWDAVGFFLEGGASRGFFFACHIRS